LVGDEELQGLDSSCTTSGMDSPEVNPVLHGDEGGWKKKAG